MNSFRQSTVAVALAGTILGLAGGSAPLAAQQASLDGSWSGTGTVQFASGQSETARCRASFSSRSGNSVSMNAVCATASGRVAQTAQLQRVSANRFAGDFHNAEYNISGSITINVRGSALSASLSGGGASAQFNLSR